MIIVACTPMNPRAGCLDACAPVPLEGSPFSRVWNQLDLATECCGFQFCFACEPTTQAMFTLPPTNIEPDRGALFV